jgi:hypothetical protein
VRFPGLGQGGAALVTAYGGPSWRPDDRCKIISWSTSRTRPSFVPTTTVNVGCFNRLGVAVDSQFTASYTIPLASSVQTRAAYLWNDQPNAPVGAWFTPNPSFQFNSFGAHNTIFHIGTGEYQVRLPGLGHPPKQSQFQVQVTAFGTPSSAPSAWCDLDGDVGTAGDGDYLVTCFDSNSRAVDSGFTLTAVEHRGHLLVPGPFTFADVGCEQTSCLAGSNTPAVTVDALGQGLYQVNLPISMPNGNVQVTTWFADGDLNDPRGRCKISSWGGTVVLVRCLDQFGADPVRTTFTVGFAS